MKYRRLGRIVYASGGGKVLNGGAETDDSRVIPRSGAVVISGAAGKIGEGDRVSGAMKPATLETGVKIQVPLFVEEGDRVKVDTRSGEYLTREK